MPEELDKRIAETRAYLEMRTYLEELIARMAQSAEELQALDKRAMNLAQAMQDYRTEIETSQQDRKNQSHPDKPASFCRLKPGGRF